MPNAANILVSSLPDPALLRRVGLALRRATKNNLHAREPMLAYGIYPTTLLVSTEKEAEKHTRSWIHDSKRADNPATGHLHLSSLQRVSDIPSSHVLSHVSSHVSSFTTSSFTGFSLSLSLSLVTCLGP